MKKVKKVYKVHIELPVNFATRKIADCSQSIILTGFLECSVNPTQMLRVQIKIPFLDAIQGQRFKKILADETL